jgi:rod shape-determining protein MreD
MLFFYICFFYLLNIDSVFIPNFWLITVFFLTIYKNSRLSLITIFLLGIFMDVFEIGIFGLNSFLFLIIYFLIKRLLPKIYFEQSAEINPNIIFIIFIFSVFYYMSKFFIFKLFNLNIHLELKIIYKFISILIFSPIFFKILLIQKK